MANLVTERGTREPRRSTATVATWRIMYFVHSDAVVLLEVFSKKTRATPKHVIEVCQQRVRSYRDAYR